MVEAANKEDLINVDGLKKSFGDLHVLDGLSFNLQKGNILGIIGPSGSGKTTLLRCIDLLELFEDGQIHYRNPFGMRALPEGVLEYTESLKISNYAHEPTPEEIRRKIGFVFQAFNLWEDRTVLQNLTLAPRVVLGVPTKKAEEQAELLLSRFDLKGKLQNKIWQLSGGQRQRVAIARTLMMQPVVLLCDEVTSALDPVLAFEVLQMIRSLREDGQTMILVTHHIDFVTSLCDHLAYLNNGRFMQIDLPDTFMRKPATPEIENFLSILRVAG